jgi:hypothetical protein
MTDFESKSSQYQKIISRGTGTVSDKFWNTLQILYVLGELVPSKKPDHPGPDFVPTYARFKNNGKLTVLSKNKAMQNVQSKELHSFLVFFINLITHKRSDPPCELGTMMQDIQDKDARELFCRQKLYEVLKKVPLVQLVGRTDDYLKSACEVIFKKSYAEVHEDLFKCFEPVESVGVLPAAAEPAVALPAEASAAAEVAGELHAEASTAAEVAVALHVEASVAAVALPESSKSNDIDTESDNEEAEPARAKARATTPVPEAPSTNDKEVPEAPSTNDKEVPEAPSTNDKEVPEAPSTNDKEATSVPEAASAKDKEATPVREDQSAEPRPGTPPTPAIPDQPEPRQPLEDLLPLVDELDGLDLPALLARFSLPAEADVLPRCFDVREPPRVPVSPSEFPELNNLQAEILHLKSQRCPDRVAQAQAKIALQLGPHQELAAQQVWHLSASPLTGYKAALCLPPGKGKTLVSLAFAEMDDFRLVIVVAHNAEGKVNWGRQLNSVRDAGVVLAKSGGFSDTEEAFLDAQEILEASEGKVYVVLTPESLSSVQHTCLINGELRHWKSCLIVDEPHLNFKDPSHHMANHLAEITRFTEHWAIPCVFVTGTLCSKPEDACNWLSGALFSRRLPLGCQCKDAPGIAQAVLRLLEVRMEDARPASEVPEGVIYDINVAQPDNLDSDADLYKQHWWFTGLDLEDIHAVKSALVAACALWRLGHGSVFFVNNVQLIDKIREALRAPCMGERFKDFFFMHGEMRDDDRHAVYKAFLEKGGVLVITPAIGGIGLNFTSLAGEHLVKAVFVLCPEFDKEALLQLLGRAARTPNELRGVMFKLVNPSKELQRVDTIIHGKQQGSQHVTGEKLVRLPGAQTKRRRLRDDDEDDRAPARKVLKLQDTPAVVTGLFYAAQCGDAVSTKAGEFWVHQCSPLQPPAVLADARKAVADLKRKLATVETLEEAMRSLRPHVEPQVEPTQEPTRTEPTQEPTLHAPTSPKLPPPGHRPPSPMAQEKSEEREGSLQPLLRVPLNKALLAAGIPIPDNDTESQRDDEASLMTATLLKSVPAWGRSLGTSELSLREGDD